MYPMNCGGVLILRGSKGAFALLMNKDEGGAPFFDELAQGVHSGAISQREAIKLGGSALVVSALAGLFPSRAEALRTRALELYYSDTREDNFTTATQQGKAMPKRLVIDSCASRVGSTLPAQIREGANR
jgi:hypothetical protein